MKILSIMWASHCGTLVKATKPLKDIIDVKVYSSRHLEEKPEEIESVIKEAESADTILLYRSTESVWQMVERRLQEIGEKIPIICVGHDPSYWSLSTVGTEIVAKVYSYITYNGEENFTNMLRFIAREVGGIDIEASEPKLIAWEGLYHPDAPHIFSTIDDYFKWYGFYRGDEKSLGTVGILFSRFYWVNDLSLI
ncbi:MAG: cobaltochelatase subunit CobN, partial [Thermodesulfovibrionales bacterium]|nr:cobaltochelatase subunit CobN [Thermodesulfovibrionales bacterium]